MDFGEIFGHGPVGCGLRTKRILLPLGKDSGLSTTAVGPIYVNRWSGCEPDHHQSLWLVIGHVKFYRNLFTTANCQFTSYLLMLKNPQKSLVRHQNLITSFFAVTFPAKNSSKCVHTFLSYHRYKWTGTEM